MKKQSFILAIAIATFTLTACGEKTQTPEEIIIRMKKEKDSIFKTAEDSTENASWEKINQIRKANGLPELTKEYKDSLKKIGIKESEFSAKHKMKSLK